MCSRQIECKFIWRRLALSILFHFEIKILAKQNNYKFWCFLILCVFVQHMYRTFSTAPNINHFVGRHPSVCLPLDDTLHMEARGWPGQCCHPLPDRHRRPFGHRLPGGRLPPALPGGRQGRWPGGLDLCREITL